MDTFTILNYHGSKKKLLDFIHTNISNYIVQDKAILDIFSGTCAVGYSLKKSNIIYANDSEYYSYIISKALLGNNINLNDELFRKNFFKFFEYNKSELLKNHLKHIELEDKSIINNDINSIKKLYTDIPTIWNHKINTHNNCDCYDLFTTYYAGSYFGINQAIEIDSLRYAIEKFKNQDIFYQLMASLFFAMKECVFSKDGHMAQPLNLDTNWLKHKKCRNKSIYDNFILKCNDFSSNAFVSTKKHHKVFNCDFKDLLTDTDIQKNVGLIYADPPYTDMQYSRYYHLLNVVAKYNYPAPTVSSQGYTKGLYTEDRFQSSLSKKSHCLSDFKKLIEFAKLYNKNLAISFAYPQKTKLQKINRYVMSIEDIRNLCVSIFGASNVKVVDINYEHSNNRNNSTKSVIEYLILCKIKEEKD